MSSGRETNREPRLKQLLLLRESSSPPRRPLQAMARLQQVDGTASSTPARTNPSSCSTSSRSDPSPGVYDDKDGYYDDNRPLGRQQRMIGRQGKADKVPAWVGSGTERWQEYKISLSAWYYANGEFLTEVQIIHKIGEMFKSAGETTAADSLLGYSQLNSTIPSFEDIIYDLDSLYKINRIGNSLDIVKDLTFKAPTAQEVIGKIEKLAKLVQGGQVTIRDILMAGAIRDNISPGSQIALVNTMAQVDHEGSGLGLQNSKVPLGKYLLQTPPSDIFFGQNSNKTDYRDHSRDQRSRSRSKERRQDSRRQVRSYSH